MARGEFSQVLVSKFWSVYEPEATNQRVSKRFLECLGACGESLRVFSSVCERGGTNKRVSMGFLELVRVFVGTKLRVSRVFSRLGNARL